MKNVFGYPYVKGEELHCDGERFITARVDAGFKQELDKAAGEVLETEEKAGLPGWAKLLSGICLLGFMIVAVGIIRNIGEVSFSQMFQNAPALFIVGGVCAVGWVVLKIVESVKFKKASASGVIDRVADSMEQLDKRSEELLGVPENHGKVDVLSFRYTEKNGKVKIKEDIFYKFSNDEMKLYRDKDNLCLADIECVYSIPIADIKGYVLKKKKAEMDEWNKDVPFNKGRYKQYKIATNDYGTIFCKYYALQFADVFGEYELFFPVYELEAFKAIADAPVENE